MSSKVKTKTVKDDEVALSYHYMEKYFRIAVSLNAVPFHYDKQRRRFSLDRSSLKYGLWLLLMLSGMVVETVQVTKELIRGILDENFGRGEWSLVMFIFISWSFIFSCHYNVHMYGEDIVSYINQVLGTREYFKESKLPPTSDHKVVKAHMYISCAQCFFQALMVSTEGTKAQFMFSNVPEEQRTPLAWGVWIPYACYRVMTNFQAGYFQYFVGILHVQTCNQILMYRRKTKQSPEESLKSYRMVQLLSKRYNFCFANTFVPFITLFAAANIIIGNYGTLRFFGELEFNLYANFPLMTSMMLLFAFTFYPNNATVMEDSGKEKTRMLFSCLDMEDALDVMNDVGDPDLQRAAGDRIIPNPAAPLVDLMRMPGVRTSITSSRDERDLQGSANMKRFGGMFQKKMGNMLEKIHQYKMARSFARSCPYVSVRLASFYPIERTTVLTIFDFIWSNTISALLTWK